MTNAVRLIDHALAYGRRRLAVFPLRPRTKEPYARTIGFKGASSCASVIGDWWLGNCALDLKDDAKIRTPVRARADSNIGIATGAKSGFWVLDLDGPEAEAAIARLEAEHGTLPVTVQQSTGRGRHLCFAWNPAFPVRNMSKRSQERIGAKIDVRGDGGYIVAPPSVHPGKPEEGIPPGRLYAWTPGRSPLEIDFAPAPAWLLDLVSPAPEPVAPRQPVKPRAPAAGRASPYGEAALDGAVRTIVGAHKGQRDTTLYRSACSVGCLVAGGEIDRDYARASLIDAGMAHVPDAMTAAQLERQVDRALLWGEGQPRSAPDRAAQDRARRPSPPQGRGAPAAEGVDEGLSQREYAAQLWASAGSPWVKASAKWFEGRGLSSTPGGNTDLLTRFRMHPAAPLGGGRSGPALLIPLQKADGDPVEALAVLPFEADRFTNLIGETDGKVAFLTPIAADRTPDVLIVAIDLQDAWHLLSNAWAEEMDAAAVVAPRLSTFAGVALGDRWGRVNPDAPALDPASPPWRASGQAHVVLAVRRDLRGPPMRARAFAGGTRSFQLEGDAAARFFGGLAEQAWSTTSTDFTAANRVRLVAPASSAGFNTGGQS
ncbi:bifunctional DNA primase/polymerase [Caulobacter endophyticus]|uniref:bifunctional DNA primase/polymerase n=1 Tax=Caulobacter endophyticus TaxID=2172652 RepID=UPI001304D709|nr:bifunctional DNA primase/polymerase [Caulobacter endophyticus]